MIESTAAAMAYGLLVAGKKRVLVFDMGGGTTDLTVIDICDGTFKVEATVGNNHLGGQNMDSCLLDLIVTKIKSGTFTTPQYTSYNCV